MRIFSENSRHACLILDLVIHTSGKGRLESPGSVTFLHPDPKNKDGSPKMSIACLDHAGICVFNPVTNKMIWEVKLNNRPPSISQAGKRGLGKYVGLWYVEKDGEKYLVTLDKYKGCLMYFLPYISPEQQNEENPKLRYPVQINVEGYSERLLHFARFGAYDEENKRFVLSLNIKGQSGHSKKVVVFDKQGRLDKSVGENKTGIQNVPSDVGQLAGICPVITNKKFHGYIMLDATGNKVLHMNKYGHVIKVSLYFHFYQAVEQKFTIFLGPSV